MRLIIHAKFELKDTQHLLEKFHMEPGGQMQASIDTAVLRYSEMYMPYDSGSLIARSYSSTVVGSGRVVFPGPYAHYLYHGEVYGPNIPIFEDDSGIPTTYRSPPKKYPTGRAIHFSPDKNPNAQAHWTEVAVANHWKDILAEARKAAKSLGW